MTRKKLPAHWPESLAHLELCVETESCPLMLMPSGQIVAPASCPGPLLVQYIDDHMQEAAKRIEASAAASVQEDELTIKCINELGLIQFDRDSSLDGLTIECLERLLHYASNIRHLTHGNHLMLTRFYSVLSDGVICVPWNWKHIREEED